MLTESVPLVQVVRGSLVESIHYGHAAVTDVHGVCQAAGNPEAVVYARSSMKLIQALPVIESGAADAFRLTDQEIAVMCSSHTGESIHTAAVGSILDKLGLNAEHLLCGPHLPYNEEEAAKLLKSGEKPTPLHNNCSGKHAGMLVLCLQLGVSIHDYTDVNHPVQQLVLDTVSQLSGVPKQSIIIGTDGCSVPVFALPLQKLAAAYAQLGKLSHCEATTARSAAASRILQAVQSHPYLLAGKDRFDTELIHTTGGRIIGKMGAEGVYALTVPDKQAGLAIKVADGSQRALYPAVVEILRQLDWISDQEREALTRFHRPVLYNWKGSRIGELRPVASLFPEPT